MIFWTGWGILVLPIGALGGLGGTSLASALGSSDNPNLGTVLGLVAAGAVIWLLGRRLNTAQPGFHPQTGQPVLYANRHRLWLLPMQWWGPIAAVVGVVVGVQSLLS